MLSQVGQPAFFLILDNDSNKLSLLFKTTTTTYVIRHDTLPTIKQKPCCSCQKQRFLDLYFNGVRAATRANVGTNPTHLIPPI